MSANQSLYAVTALSMCTHFILRFIKDSCKIYQAFISVQATVEAAGGMDENRNIFALRSEEELKFGERIIEGTIGERYSEYIVAFYLEKCGT